MNNVPKKENLLRRTILTAAAFVCFFLPGCGTPSAQMPAPAEAPAPTPAETPAPTPVPENTVLLLGGDELTLPCGRPYDEPGFIALGENGENAAERVRIEGEVTCWLTGDYELSYVLYDRVVAEHEDRYSHSYVAPQELDRAVRKIHIVPAELPETVPAQKKVIYLSFDDGPCEKTPAVLDTLAKHNIKATFFIIGSNRKYFDILPRMAAEGHSIGIHCYNHHYGLYDKPEWFFEDFMQAQQALYEATGAYADVSRFPGGSNTASYLAGHLDGGYEELEKRMHDMGVRYYDWSVQPEAHDDGAAGTLRNFINEVPEADGPIICLQHDTRTYSIAALESMIQWALENGYSFAPLDPTVPEVHFNQQE